METPPVSARSPRAPRSPAGDSDTDTQTCTEDAPDETLEPLLQDNEDRFCFLPIQHPDMYEFYKKAQASYWTVEEVDLSQDDRDWKNLTNGEQHFIKHVLAFFAASDGIVLENLAVRFMQEIQIPEARAFYAFQAAVETVHAEMYGRLLECYVADAAERRDLFRAMHTLPTVAKKAVWALRWIGEGLGVGLVEDASRAA
ncbi:small chain of ribonucleotide reductase, partial [Helicosporidium sp. ATCC 50920]